MKIVVLGAGVTGASSAYFLARDGHEVSVVERQTGPGLETSYANGGQVSVSHATPWATPQTPWKVLGWLGRDDAPLLFRGARWDLSLWMWSWRFLRNCTASRTRQNTLNTVRLAQYSRDGLKELRTAERLAYDSLDKGILHIFRNPRAYEAHHRSAEVMACAGLAQTALSPDELVSLEPALATAAPALVGGLYSKDDESGDAHTFTRQISHRAEQRGAKFLYAQTLQRICQEDGHITGVTCLRRAERDTVTHTADLYVVCLGSWSPLLCRSLGLSLPIYPVKGYSITLPLASSNVPAPTLSITDDDHKMVYSRLGNRLRAAGTAELAGWSNTLDQKRVAYVQNQARSLFPHAGDYAQAIPWCGLRPKTPDSLPYIGPTPHGNLFLNTGHGTLGWTMAVGSARLLADLVMGRDTDIDPTPYALRA